MAPYRRTLSQLVSSHHLDVEVFGLRFAPRLDQPLQHLREAESQNVSICVLRRRLLRRFNVCLFGAERNMAVYCNWGGGQVVKAVRGIHTHSLVSFSVMLPKPLINESLALVTHAEGQSHESVYFQMHENTPLRAERSKKTRASSSR